MSSILVVTTVHPPDDPRIRVKSIGTLIARGWDVTYVCRRPGPRSTEGMRVLTVGGGRFARLLRAGWIAFRRRDDVVVVHDPELLAFAVPLGALRGRNRVVFDLHENLPRQLATRTATPRLLRRATSLVSRSVLRLAERVLTITVAEPGYAALFRDPPVAFANLPVYAALPRRSPEANGVVYVGDISEARGVGVLVEAMATLPGVRLTLIGRCPDELQRRLMARAWEADVPLAMPGFLPYREAWSLAAEHLVGVSPLLDLPNYRDSLPTKVLEYRAVGLIPVVSDLPASAAAVRASPIARVVQPGDVEALAAAIAEALGDADAPAAATEDASAIRSGSGWDAEAFAAFYEALIAAR